MYRAAEAMEPGGSSAGRTEKGKTWLGLGVRLRLARGSGLGLGSELGSGSVLGLGLGLGSGLGLARGSGLSLGSELC